MHESEAYTPYPPKPEGFQTCVWWEVSQALSGCVSASIQSGACQAVSGSHLSVSWKVAVPAQSAEKRRAEILSCLSHQLHYHSLVSIAESVRPDHSSLQWRHSHGSPFRLSTRDVFSPEEVQLEESSHKLEPSLDSWIHPWGLLFHLHWVEHCLKQKQNLKPLLHECAPFKHLLLTCHASCIPSARRQSSSGKVEVHGVVVVATFLGSKGLNFCVKLELFTPSLWFLFW